VILRGSLITVLGSDFSFGEQIATRLPLPAAMNGITLSAGAGQQETSLGLLLVSPTHINVLTGCNELTIAAAP
jgi:hypothetical protein